MVSVRAKQKLPNRIKDFWYCDNRVYSETRPRFWAVKYECPNCLTLTRYAKELKFREAIQYANLNTNFCVECE